MGFQRPLEPRLASILAGLQPLGSAHSPWAGEHRHLCVFSSQSRSWQSPWAAGNAMSRPCVPVESRASTRHLVRPGVTIVRCFLMRTWPFSIRFSVVFPCFFWGGVHIHICRLRYARSRQTALSPSILVRQSTSHPSGCGFSFARCRHRRGKASTENGVSSGEQKHISKRLILSIRDAAGAAALRARELIEGSEAQFESRAAPIAAKRGSDGLRPVRCKLGDAVNRCRRGRLFQLALGCRCATREKNTAYGGRVCVYTPVSDENGPAGATPRGPGHLHGRARGRSRKATRKRRDRSLGRSF